VEGPHGQVPHDRKVAGVALILAALVLVACFSLCGLCGHAGLPYAKFLFFPGGFCSDDDARFLRKLGRESLVTTAPPEFSEPDRYAFQPCEGNGDSAYYGGVGTRWTYPPTAPDRTTVIHFYQQLAWDGDWHLDSCPIGHVVLCASKDIDETNVSFRLLPRVDENGQPGYTAELTYSELGR
jgi:hypothetical protein